MFYVYRFLDQNDNIIYIGKTNNMDNRMYIHFHSGHLPKECYCSVSKIEYIKLETKIEMDIVELYYINKVKPKYNIKDKQNEELQLNLKEEYKWHTYLSNSITQKKEFTIKLNGYLANENLNLKNKNKELSKRFKELNSNFKREIKRFKNLVIDELSNENRLTERNSYLEKQVKFYEMKTDFKYTYIFDK